MNNVKINIEQELKQIMMYKNEVITLFISDTEKHEGCNNTTQIEIRKKRDGEIEIFVNDKVSIKSFDEWYSL